MALKITENSAIQVNALTVVYRTTRGEIPAVKDVTLDIPAGKVTGIIGESGSGKTTLAMALMNAVQKPGYIQQGAIMVNNVGNVLEFTAEQLRRVRGRDVSFVFQAAQNSLNPLRRVGHQILDMGRSHGVRDKRSLLKRARELLKRMGLDAERVLASYQHELSGGMRQRVGIVFALILDAKVLILDEPTTALDMLSQASVLKIIHDIHRERHLTTILITHDMGVVADIADYVVVMYGGKLVEEGATFEVLNSPLHPYTQGLIRAIPRIVGDLSSARPLKGSPPDLSLPMDGCRFRDRCDGRLAVCDTEEPLYVSCNTRGHKTACHGVIWHD